MQAHNAYKNLEITLIILEYSLAEFKYARAFFEYESDLELLDELISTLAMANKDLLIAIYGRKAIRPPN